MNYIKDTLQINDIETAEAASAGNYFIEQLTRTGARLHLVVAFDHESSTGLCRSHHGQLFAFRVRESHACIGMLNASVYSLRDISLFDGTLKAVARKTFDARAAAGLRYSPADAITI